LQNLYFYFRMDVQSIVLMIIACIFGLYLLSAAKVKVSYWMILYILVCVVSASSSVNFLLQRGQQTAAMILLVLLILIYIFYGLRWFTDKNAQTPGSIQWPPIVNMCPDFMVSWTGPDNKVYCYDSSNIYSLSAGSNGLSTVSINGVNKPVYLIKDPSQNAGAKDLTADTTGSRWPLAYKLQTNAQSVTSGSVMRWEGVWDGSNLSSKNIPVP